MGLDAVAFRLATLTDEHERTDACRDNDHVLAHVIDDDFHRSLRGLTAGRCYRVADRAITVSSSYSGHGQFREVLARVFYGKAPRDIWNDPEAYADRPFFELLQFADNEGTIGPLAAADLARDFAEGREQWDAALDVSEWDRRKYDEWAEAFEAAANDGLVRFA